MKQSRINKLARLRCAVLAIRNATHESKDAVLDHIVSPPYSDEEKDAKKRIDYWASERVRAIHLFTQEWRRIYGFDYFPQCGCEQRIPKEEFNYLNKR